MCGIHPHTDMPKKMRERTSVGYGRVLSLRPWDWRHKNNKTVILGAFSVPLNAQAILLGPSAIEGVPISGLYD